MNMNMNMHSWFSETNIHGTWIFQTAWTHNPHEPTYEHHENMHMLTWTWSWTHAHVKPTWNFNPWTTWNTKNCTINVWGQDQVLSSIRSISEHGAISGKWKGWGPDIHPKVTWGPINLLANNMSTCYIDLFVVSAYNKYIINIWIYIYIYIFIYMVHN